MKSLLIAAALILAPSAVMAQAAAATLPNTLDRPAGPVAATPGAVSAVPTAPADPKAEATLRAVIAGFQAGQVDYGLMTEGLAAQVREQEPRMMPLLQQFGALRTVTHTGVQDGADLFAVAFARQATQWVIGFNADGKVAILLFRPAP